MRIAILLFALSFTQSVVAQSVTAVCKEPTGRVLGVNGTVLGDGRELDEPDSITGGLFTILWPRSEDRGQIISQGSGGGEPSADIGKVIFKSDEQVTFLVTYPSAVWLYSLYPKRGLLLISSHNNGLAIDEGGAIIKSYKASCKMSGV